MAFNYPRTAATADRLIDRFGGDIIITRTGAAGAVTAMPTRGVVVNTVTHVLGDSGISIGDDEIMLDRSVLPEPGDRISYNGQSRVVVDPVVPENPAGTLLYVTCYARAG